MAATLVWFTGCEAGPPTPNDNTGVGREFTALSKGGAVSPSITTTPVRTGTYALKLPTDGAARGSMGTYPSNAATFWRGYFFIGGNPTNAIIILAAGSNNLSLGSTKYLLWLNTNGTLGWDFNLPASSTGPISSGATPVTLNAWNLIEIKFLRDVAAGGMEIFLNGVLQVSQFDRATTTGTSLTTMTIWPANDAQQPGTGRSGQDMFWDDMAFAFGAYIGAGQSIAVQGKAGTPTYDAFTKNGAATSAAAWSETPWSGGKNCTSSTVAARQTMLIDDVTLASLIGATATINAALVVGVMKIVTSGNCRITRRVGGVDTDSATKVLSTVDQIIPEGLDHTMDAFVPTRAQLVSGTTEIGTVANSTNLLTVEDMWLLVDFTPGAPTPLLRDEGSPVEWLATLARDDFFPAEWRGATVLNRNEPTPAEWLRRLARDEILALEWLGTPSPFFVRSEGTPVEWTGVAPGELLLIWRVLQRLNTKLALQWVVLSGALNQSLTLQWQIKQKLAPLTLRWNVIPPIGPPPAGSPGSGVVPLPPSPSTQDIQRPTSIERKTP